MNNTFTWTDLSTFDMDEAKHFYKQCFNWHFENIGNDYTLCNTESHPSAGLYKMPDNFIQMGMPSFWMSYILVEDIFKAVELAERCGGKVELQPQTDQSGGMISLIRDPSGAGFTCYQGKNLDGRGSNQDLGQMAWNELHVSDISLVEDFYKMVFGWTIKPSKEQDRYEVFTNTDRPIAGIQVSSNDIKGDKEYWGVYFLVDSLSSSQQVIEKAGGEVIYHHYVGNKKTILAFDSQGAAFYLIEK